MIRHDNVEAIYRLSPMQEGMLFHTLRSPEAGLYVNQVAYLLEGPLDVAAFARSWQRVSDRHAVLRTAFLWKADRFLQVAFKRAGAPLAQEDWRGFSGDEQEELLKRRLDEDRRRGFSPTQVPLMRLALFQLRDDAWYFLWSHHHVLMDGWSGALLLKEVMAYYQSFRLGSDLDLPKPRAYREYIVWLDGQDKALAEAYWRSALAGFTTPTPLPRALRNSASAQALPEAGQEDCRRRLPAAATADLRRLAARHRLTLNTIVQGLWGLLLSRFSRDYDVIFGAATSGRPTDLAGADNIIGLFINTLPARIRVKPEARVIAWLEGLQTEQAEARQYDYVALVDIQSWSEAPRGMPLFESLVAFENYAQDVFETNYGEHVRHRQNADELMLQTVCIVERASYPLNLTVGPAEQLHLMLSYDPRQFLPDDAEDILSRFHQLLINLTVSPDQCLSQLQWLSEAEREQILVEWNETGKSSSPDLRVHKIFEEQAERSPDRIALIGEGQALSYGELNRRTNQLGNYLQGLGVGPEVVVGLCLERSVEIVVAALGTLKAGGAYLPLDPDYPLERLSFMMEDAGVGVILTERKTADRLPAFRGRAVCLDVERERISRLSDVEPASKVDEGNLAYVIYTSGSTGRPKGVMVAHRGLCNLVGAQKEIFGLGPDSRVLQFAPLSFDASVGEIFGALGAGGSLHVYCRESLRPGDDLLRVLREDQITMVTLPPTALAGLSEERLFNLQTVISAGEACPSEIAECWVRGRRFFNAYGPAEATVCASIGEVERGSDGKPAIGRPINNTRLYILDREMSPVPVGVRGELSISGMGLARGYLRRSEQTAESFVPNPFSKEPGARLYKTGDLARYWLDGRVEYLGRSDVQAKIRGVRIEPGEIEALLSQQPGVRQVVVVVREDTPGDHRLVSYVVTEPETRLTPEELRRSLQAKLPEHMTPAVFVMLDRLPLTPNGKLDRTALERQLQYWREQLHGLEPLALPTDHPRRTKASYRGSTVPVSISGEVASKLDELSRQEGVTMLMIFLAAINVLMNRYTGQEDIVIGTKIANRKRCEMERIIGFFVNTLALRTDLSCDPTFRTLLGRVKEVTLNAYTHQDLPFEKLVEALYPQLDLSRMPLFQVALVLQKMPGESHQSADLGLSTVRVDNENSKFDLTFLMVETTDGFAGAIEYNVELFETPTIHRMRDHFHALLMGIVADPGQPLSSYSLTPQSREDEINSDFMTSFDDL